ncbi:MAG: class I SAM-dependent methyltransferase [Hyphomicrobiaceae bacterium]
MDLYEYRNSPSERQRTEDLLRLIPSEGRHALDIGARDGHFSLLMADRFESITALDLTQPNISHPRIQCVQGNAAQMRFPDRAFDFVFCAEVLEHIPKSLLPDVCREIERVAAGRILIGVPYKQDIRVGQTTCHACGKLNPPWGHVNSFDEQRLMKLFPHCEVETVSFVGITSERTNAVSALLMNFAGNPYGTYDQEEPCIHCGRPLLPPPKRNPAQLVATRLAFWSCRLSDLFAKPHGNWIHMVLHRVRDV